jgi:hypothetical protein
MFFVTQFIVFHLDKQHPFWIEETTDVGSSYGFLISLSLNPLCPRVHPCECGCIHEDFLSPIPDGGFNRIRMDGSLVDAWPYFPGLKVGQTFISFIPLRLLMSLISNRDIVR